MKNVKVHGCHRNRIVTDSGIKLSPKSSNAKAGITYEVMRFCPTCSRCWEKSNIYKKGNIPSIGKVREICSECKKRGNL